MIWRKSSFSANNGACVEAARLGAHIGVRDSKDPGGPVLTVTAAQWQAFLRAVKDGAFGA